MSTIKRIFTAVILMAVWLSFAGDYSNFFWEVRHDGVTAYFCGSVHLMKKNYYPMRQEIETAFDDSDVLVLEFDINKTDFNKIQQLISSQAEYQDDQSLETVLPSDSYQKLKAELKEYQYDIESVKKQKPWFMTLTLSSTRVSDLGYLAEGGTDIYFSQKASDKIIMQLETPEAQFDMLSSLPEPLQIKYLIKYIDEKDDFNRQVEELMQGWMKGDEEIIYRIMNEELKNNPDLEDYYHIMFTQRNLDMTDKIEKLLTSKDNRQYFVVVGAGHFLGDEGIINLLQKRGYKLTRK